MNSVLTVEHRRYMRKVLLREAGGKHTPAERRAILTLQKRRCLYCHVRFTKKNPATNDHFLGVKDGGTNWGINLVMACRGCNSRRCDIPFRTYCKLLSPTQNRRILRYLASRILALDFEKLTVEAFSSFSDGLEAHDPQHGRYLDIQRRRPVMRRYARTNKLLPRTPASVLKAVYGA